MQSQQSKQLYTQAKYGRFNMADPFSALQRDSDALKNDKFTESAAKALVSDQYLQLDHLIETQHSVQIRMREQLAAVEKRYHKVIQLSNNCFLSLWLNARDWLFYFFLVSAALSWMRKRRSELLTWKKPTTSRVFSRKTESGWDRRW